MLTRPNHYAVYLVNVEWNMWTEKLPFISVDQSNYVHSNQSEYPCQLTWSIDERTVMNFSSSSLYSVK